MEKTIWKFNLHFLYGAFILKMPKNAEILTLQKQKDDICLWALVIPEEEEEERHFELFGTGHNIPYPSSITRKYIGTFQLHNGDFVFHLFEKLNS